MGTLTGKVALVTGGVARHRRRDREAARAPTVRPSRSPMRRSRDKADQVVRDIAAAGGKALAIAADSGDAQSLRAAVAETVAKLGGLDVLVSNAGVITIAPLDQLKLEDFDRMVGGQRARACSSAAQEAARHMKEGGRIITIGSVNADRMPFAGGAVYAMTKAAVAGLTRGLARDLGPRGITVNNVQPGPVDTDLNPADGPMADAMRGWMALPRYGRADEIAAMVSYLAGPEAGFVTGASLTIDGGFGA